VLVAYHVGRLGGSEAAASAHWLDFWLARGHRVTLICHRCDDRIEDPRVGIVRIQLPGWASTLGERLQFYLWTRLANEWLSRASFSDEVLCVHHASWGSSTAPVVGSKGHWPVIWGPLGGGQVAPISQFYWYRRGLVRELARSARVALHMVLARLRLRSVIADVALATNLETYSLATFLRARRVQYMIDSAIPSKWLILPTEPVLTRERFRILWVGRLEPHKAPELAIEAFRLAVDALPGAHLVFIGEGSEKRYLQDRVNKLGLSERVAFLGQRPRDQVRDEMLRADALLFTSMRDSFGPVLLEAMGAGLPVVALAHQGVAMLPSDVVVRVPLEPSAKKQKLALANALLRCLTDQGLRRQVAAEAERFARENGTWDSRHAEMEQVVRFIEAKKSTSPVCVQR